MAKYKVREGFVVHLPKGIYGKDEVIDLSPDEADLVSHQIEPIQPTKTKEKPNDGTDKHV